MVYFILGHAKDLSLMIFLQAQEQFGALIFQKFLPRNILDLIQGDQIEPFELVHRFQVCFNKAILFHYVILLIPSPPPPFLEDTVALVILTSETDQRKDLIIYSKFLITFGRLYGESWKLNSYFRQLVMLKQI
jgi:hypothetical protein